MAIGQGDGSIVLTTKVDTSGMKKSTNELRSEAMKLAAQYRKAGMSQSEAQKKAYQELGITTKETEKATKKTKEYGEQAQKSGSTAEKAFASVGEKASSVGKAVAAVGKAAAAVAVASAAAIVPIVKSSVEAYADYEQLVGGVETLFKGSSKKLIEYAHEAYRTTGQSANEYMENVTSFSASLLSAVGGDTEKAAEIANAAMISISDNVNKMGSSAESVTMAFQGFAKQQYMLLDNLKLGKIHYCRV